MLFTICTVCFKAEKSIAQTIDSVAALFGSDEPVALGEIDEKSLTPEASGTARKDFEYLIIDGASPDGTLEIIEEKRSLFPEGVLRVISEPDEGIYDAMNKGIEQAKGRFIIFINADDLIAPRALEYAREVLSLVPKPKEVDGIAGSVKVLADEGIDPKLARTRKAQPEMLKGKVPKEMVTGHQGMFFSVNRAREMGGFDTRFKLASDYDFYVRSIQAQSRWLLIDRTLATFYLGGASFNLFDTAREYRAVRIARGMNPLLAYSMYALNIFNGLRARGFKGLK